MENDDDFRFSVVDVYDIAADIGKEFEKIIDHYGPDVLTSLMPRVITALEQLERVAEKQENSGALIDELRSTVLVLETQKLGQAEHRQRYARDLEDIERDMREEKQELSAKVSQLLDENRKLSTCLARTTDDSATTPSSLTDDESSLEPEVARGVVNQLHDAVEQQRDQLHALQLQLQQQHAESEQLSQQLERVTQTNKDLRRRSRQSTQQIRQLVEERAELHVSLQEQQRSLDVLNQRLGVATKENFDLATAATNDNSKTSSTTNLDRNDPNRPRFTLTELKDILYQRNELKARLSDLEDELALYRPPRNQQRSSHIICPPDEANGPPLLDLDRLSLDPQEGGAHRHPQDSSPTVPPTDDDHSSGDELLPVQGPMPYEPDDAPWRRTGNRESGIRKFFKRMKKLSGVMLNSGDVVVLGTPTIGTTNLQHMQNLHRQQLQQQRGHHHQQQQQLFHSTPNTAQCTPTPSLLNVSSPPSLRSLPLNLTGGTPPPTSFGESAHDNQRRVSFDSEGHQVRLSFGDTEGNQRRVSFDSEGNRRSSEIAEFRRNFGSSGRSPGFSSSSNANLDNSGKCDVDSKILTSSGIYSKESGFARSDLNASRRTSTIGNTLPTGLSNTSVNNSSTSCGDITSITGNSNSGNREMDVKSPSSGFSLDKFRSKFGIASGSAVSNTSDGRPRGMSTSKSTGSLKSTNNSTGGHLNFTREPESGPSSKPKSDVIQIPSLLS